MATTISKADGAFLAGRQILDHALMVNEVIEENEEGGSGFETRL